VHIRKKKSKKTRAVTKSMKPRLKGERSALGRATLAERLQLRRRDAIYAGPSSSQRAKRKKEEEWELDRKSLADRTLAKKAAANKTGE